MRFEVKMNDYRDLEIMVDGHMVRVRVTADIKGLVFDQVKENGDLEYIGATDGEFEECAS